VVAYDQVNPELGTIDDLESLAAALHERGMSLCVDLVLNHTADEHPWALAARNGDPAARRFYFFSPDRTVPDAFEATLREVFPDFAPGNFTWLADCEQWVWTTFNEYQWDLNWSNPDVFAAMFAAMLDLAQRGVDVLRLDAVPFLWKRVGTSCENLPEAHDLLCALRALMAIAAPATVFKAEAIVAPDDLKPYLGAGDPPRRECDLAYNNQLMVLLWSSLATGEAQLMSHALGRLGRVPDRTSWVNYVRCHDDIGWAVTDIDAAAVGWNGHAHRSFLSEFYAGTFPTSFAKGEVFQFNPATLDARVSGSAASLCGIEQALASNDPRALDLAFRRLELVYSVVYMFGGVPLLYMGDELALLNDHSYLADPATKDDNRWMHRPRMAWDIAARRTTPGTIEHRAYTIFSSLAHDRRRLQVLHASSATTVMQLADPRLMVIRRDHPSFGAFVAVANFSGTSTVIGFDALGDAPWQVERAVDAHCSPTALTVGGLGYAWLSSS
jgi:amylosucrase